jgi:HD superfamily phosphohydrolase YqeK
VTPIDRDAAEALIAARLSARRRDHSHRVAAEAVLLATRHRASPEAAEVGGLLHDYCRELSDEEILELTYITTTYEMHATMSRALRLEYDDVDDPVVEVPDLDGNFAGLDVMAVVDEPDAGS